MQAMLIIFGGLPGTGKSTIARLLAERMGAVYLRIDRIEQAIRDSGLIKNDVADAGYRVAYGLAEDNLKLGRAVVADSVNPIAITRRAWRKAAAQAGVDYLEVEVLCTDTLEHRRRVEKRRSEVAGLCLPNWADVEAREYEPWTDAPVRVDTCALSVERCVETIEHAAARLRR